MKIVPLLVASTFAVAIAAVPVMAQSQQNDEGNSSQSAQMNWQNSSGQNDFDRNDQDNRWDRDRDWNNRRGGQQNNEESEGQGYGNGYGWMNRHHRWMMGGGPGWMMGRGPGWMMGGPGWMMGRRGWGGHAGGAHFMFKRGNEKIVIQCPGDENINVCVNAASRLMDKLKSMDNQGSGQPNRTPPTSSNPKSNNSNFNRE